MCAGRAEVGQNRKPEVKVRDSQVKRPRGRGQGGSDGAAGWQLELVGRGQ